MDLELQGRNILVTGATGGLGSAAAQLLSAEGARLALQGRSEQKLGALARSLSGGDPARAPQCFATDLEDPEAARHLVDRVSHSMGPIDALVACAGASRPGAFADLDDAAWRANLEIKLFATIRLVRAVLPAMRAAKRGRIVLVVGNNGREPLPQMLPGSVANAGLLALVRGLAQEIAGDGVAINAVNPGPVDSERWRAGMALEAQRTGRTLAEVEAPHRARIPAGRLARPEEVARHIAFLASPMSSHMNGAAVMVDGGAARGLG